MNCLLTHPGGAGRDAQMKVIRTRVGASVACCGLLTSALSLTVITATSAAAATGNAAAVSLAKTCSRATVIEADRCVPAQR